MIKRFKQRTFAVLINIQTFKYTFKNARKQKNSRIFTRIFFKYAKVVDLIFVHNQIIITWNNLNWQFRRNISKLTKLTKIRHFFDHHNNHVDIRFKIISFKTKIFRQYENRKFFNNKFYYQNDRSADENRVNFNFNRIFHKKEIVYQNDYQNRERRRNERSRKW